MLISWMAAEAVVMGMRFLVPWEGVFRSMERMGWDACRAASGNKGLRDLLDASDGQMRRQRSSAVYAPAVAVILRISPGRKGATARFHAAAGVR